MKGYRLDVIGLYVVVFGYLFSFFRWVWLVEVRN